MTEKTNKNLLSAFAGESQANRKYLAFAKQAEKDGLPQIARLFRAVAEAETIHAHSHLRVSGGIKSTVENLKTAIEGEKYEFTSMYPEFLKIAEEENHKAAARTFDYANKVEKIHNELYSKALESVEKKTDLPKKPIFVCEVCGYTVEDKLPDKCPICGTTHKRFKEIS